MKTKNDFNGLVVGSRIHFSESWYDVKSLGDSSLTISLDGGDEFEIQYEQINGWTDLIINNFEG